MSIRFIVAFVLIVFVTPQSSILYYNYVVEALHSTGIFFNYAQAKEFVFRFTWFCIFVFILLNFLVLF